MSTELLIKINGDAKGYAEAIKEAKKETADLNEALARTIQVAGVAMLGFGAAIAYTVKEAGDLETITAQFTTLLQSTEAAKNMMKELTDFAAKTPFQLPGIARAAQVLLAFKVDVKDLQMTLKGIGDIAAVTGADFFELSVIFGQVRAATKLTGERFLQLQERAVPIAAALAKIMKIPGASESAIKDLVSKGEIDFKTFEKAFLSLSQEGNLAFNGMAILAEQLGGKISTLKDNLSLLAADIGTDFLPAVKGALDVMIAFLEFFREHPVLTYWTGKFLLVGGAITGVTFTAATAAVVLLKLRASFVAAGVAANVARVAVKGFIGSTGLGLVIAFLPEIITAVSVTIKAVVNLVKGFWNYISVILSGLGGMWLSWFTIDPNRFKEAFKKVSNAVKAGWEETKSEYKKSSEEVKAINKENSEAVTDDQKSELDKRIVDLKNANEQLRAELNDQTKEELAILKKRQELRTLVAEAGLVQDKKRKDLMLEQVKLLEEQILKLEKEFKTKQERELTNANQKLQSLLTKQKDDEIKIVEARLKLKAEREDAALIKDAERKKLALLQVEISEQQLALLEQKYQEQRSKSDLEKSIKVQRLQNESVLLKAELEKQSIEYRNFLKRQQDIEIAQQQASINLKDEERALTLENLRLQYENLLQEQVDYYSKKTALELEQNEKDRILKEELLLLNEEERIALREKDLTELRDQIQLKSDIEAKAAKDSLIQKRKENQLFIEEEKKFGRAYAEAKREQRSDEFKNEENAAATLVQLQNSKYGALSTVGKIAAVVQIKIATAKGATEAMAAFAEFGPAGPALGAAAAGAIILYGAEQIKNVLTAQKGGVVPGFGRGDIIPAMLEPQELIVPRQNYEEVIQAVTEKRLMERQTIKASEPASAGFEQVAVSVEIGFTDDAADFLTVKQNQSQVLGVSQLIRR